MRRPGARLDLAQMGRRPDRVAGAVEARLPGAAMRAASLLLVLVLAKAIALAGHRLDYNWWSPVAYFWHDALIFAAAAVLDLALSRRPRVAWTAYAVLALYV